MENVITDNTTVVADLFILGRTGDKFDKELKKVFYKKAKISKAFVDDYNKDWQSRGKFYEIDEKATRAYHEDATVLKDIRKEKDQSLADAADMVMNAVKKSKRK